jgi:hypothetical protein
MAFARLEVEQTCRFGSIGHRKPAKSGLSDAVSTGNSLCEK